MAIIPVRAEAASAIYYTSVDVHPIFWTSVGSRQLAEMWERLGSPRPFLVVEAGAGVGRLAAHILDFAASALPAFYAALEYVAVEHSPARRSEHSALASFAHSFGSLFNISGKFPMPSPPAAFFQMNYWMPCPLTAWQWSAASCVNPMWESTDDDFG